MNSVSTPAIDLDPEQLSWSNVFALVTFSLLFLVVMVLLAIMLWKSVSRSVAIRNEKPPHRIPPIPMAAEYDRNLSIQERAQELEWIEDLMAKPAFGEADAESNPKSYPEGSQ